MSASTGPILAVGTITLFNDIVIHHKTWQQDSRVVVGTVVAALGLGLVERVSTELAVGIAWTALVALLFVRLDPKTPSPIESFMSWYQGSAL